MTSRNNHYLPKWYQKGFYEPGANVYSYLDLSPKCKTLSDGRVVTENNRFEWPATKAFCQKDLYSRFFGKSVNDEIERVLFGRIDARGASAVRAFIGENKREWHDNFEALFEFIDAQKIRTPSGLEWLRAQYPRLTQNELMQEMQGIRMMHCTIWSEGVREIVSAEDSDVKFIVSDHPVSVFNHAFLDAIGDAKSTEPSIALKGSQTVFPLNRDFCLILTNLEYAQNREVNPLEKRTFAGNFRSSLVRTDAFIRTRKLASNQVTHINRIIKLKAKRFIAAGKEEWLYPELSSVEPLHEIRRALLPSKKDLLLFGGEMYFQFDTGEVRYQDSFGRTEKEREFLKKSFPSAELKNGDDCGCGSARAYRDCCKSIHIRRRPTWTELSIRERNVVLIKNVLKIISLEEGGDWTAVRRQITDEKIKSVYELFDALWPLETDLLAMLPKPDGRPRAVYTGVLHPQVIRRRALGLSMFFGELLIENPLLHPRTMRSEFSPLENPRRFRQDFLNSIIFLISIFPLIECGIVNLFPSPCSFNSHLRNQVMEIARRRFASLKINQAEEPELRESFSSDQKRAMLLLPRGVLERQVRKASPELDQDSINQV